MLSNHEPDQSDLQTQSTRPPPGGEAPSAATLDETRDASSSRLTLIVHDGNGTWHAVSAL